MSRMAPFAAAFAVLLWPRPALAQYPCGVAPCARGQFPPASWRPYSDTSPFNTPVPPNPSLIPESYCLNVPAGSTCSAEMVKRLLGDISRTKQPNNWVVAEDGSTGWPTYYGTSSDPVFGVTCTAFGPCPDMPSGHAPAGARIQGAGQPYGGTDRHLTWIDQTTGKEFDLWNVGFQDLFDRREFDVTDRGEYGDWGDYGWGIQGGSDGGSAVALGPWAYATAYGGEHIGSDDYSVGADFTFPPYRVALGLLARTDPEHWYWDYRAYIDNPGDGSPMTVNLVVDDNYWGTSTTLASVSLPSEQHASMLFLAKGTTSVRLEVWVDGVMQIAYDNASPTIQHGIGGLWSGGGDGGTADNFLVAPILPESNQILQTGNSGWTMVDGDGTSRYGEATAGHMGSLAGRVRVEEMLDAIDKTAHPNPSDRYIHHALTIAIDCTNGRSISPAGDSVGRPCNRISGKVNDNAPPMGGRLWLNMTMDAINALAGVAEWQKVLLRTLSKYGAYINDTGSSFYFSIQTESGLQYTAMGTPDKWLQIGNNLTQTSGENWWRWFGGPGHTGYKGLWNNKTQDAWTTEVWNNLRFIAPPSNGNVTASISGFNAVASTLDTDWTVPYGSFSTDGDYAIAGASSLAATATLAADNWARWASPISGSDYAVESDIILPSGASAGIISRSDEPTDVAKNGYLAQVSTGGSVTLYRRNSWQAVPLGTAAATVSPGTTYDLKLVTRGSNPVHLELWLDGVMRVTYDDSSASRITGGVPAIQSPSAGVKYDYVKVEPVPPLFTDDFNRTTGLGANWSTQHGSYSTNGSAAVSGTPPINGNWARLVTSPGTNDYAVSARVSVPSGALYSGVGARSMYSANIDQTLYAAQISSQGSVNLYRRNDWTWTLLGTASQTILSGASYDLKLIATGTNPVHLEVWLDGVRRISYNDSSPSRVTTGGAAIENYNAGVKYEWFRVDAP